MTVKSVPAPRRAHWRFVLASAVAALLLLLAFYIDGSWKHTARPWCDKAGLDSRPHGRRPVFGVLSESQYELEMAEWNNTRTNNSHPYHNAATGERWFVHSPAFSHEAADETHLARRELWVLDSLGLAGAAEEKQLPWEMYETMEPGGFVNIQHIHPEQAELVVVIKGSIRCDWYDPCGEQGQGVRTLHAADWVLLPPGLSHGLQHDAGEEVVMRVRYTPGDIGSDMEDFFATLSSLSHRGALHALPFLPGVPDPLHTAQVWSRFPRLMAFWFLPTPIQSMVESVGLPLAEAFGFYLR